MEKVNRYARQKLKEVADSMYTFESLFDVVHNQDDRIFCEYMHNFRIAELSYAGFRSYARKMATHLRDKLSLPADCYVGLYMENSVNWVAIFWALLMLGYKPLLLNSRLPLAITNKVLALANCTQVVTDEAHGNIQLSASIVTVENGLGVLSTVSAQEEYLHCRWADEIALCSTATSLNVKVCAYTGKEFTHQILNAKGILAQNKMIKKHYKGRLKLLAFLPFYHIFGLIATYFWFATFGRTFVFLKDYSSNAILHTVQRHEVTHLFAVPLLWHSLHREIVKQVNSLDDKQRKKFDKGVKLSMALQNLCPSVGLRLARRMFEEVQSKTFGPSIKFMISGGSYITRDALTTINAIGYPLFNGYGSTEIGITSVELRSRPKYRILASIGKPFVSVNYKLEDGVLNVCGDSICKRITTEKEVTEMEEGSWYNTRDVAHCDEKGYYFVDGRRDEVFVGVNGEKINPDLVEQELKFCSIDKYSVLGLNLNGKQQLCLVVEVDKNLHGVLLKRVAEDIAQNLEHLSALNYHLDGVFVSRQRISNPNAIKVSRSALIKSIEGGQVVLIPLGELNADKLADETVLSRETCDGVKQIMARILNKDVGNIADTAHFVFDLGGTSLDYCTLLVELEKVYDVRIDLQENNCSTALEFSNYIISHLQ